MSDNVLRHYGDGVWEFRFPNGIEVVLEEVGDRQQLTVVNLGRTPACDYIAVVTEDEALSQLRELRQLAA